MQQVARLTPVTGGRISSIDFASTGDYMQHYRLGGSHDHQRHADMSPSTGASAVAGLDATASGIGSADGTKKNSTDGADSDDKSASIEEPDVFAPSDIAYNPQQGQTGLHTPNTHKFKPGHGASGEASYSGTKPVCSDGNTVSSDEDEDDYTGVDLISESGDEDPMVNSSKQEAAIDSEGGNIDGAFPRDPPNSPYDAFSFSYAEVGQVDFDLDPFLTDDIFFKDQMNLIDHHEGVPVADDFASANDHRPASLMDETPRRRVRFADPLMLPSEASKFHSADVDSGRIPSTRVDDDMSNKVNEYFSSHGHSGAIDEALRSEAKGINAFDVFAPKDNDDDQEDNDEDTDSSVGNSSGYETDQGETTEEEDVPASATTRPSAVLRDSSSITLANNSFSGQPLPRAPTTNLRSARQWGPTLGSFVTDPRKPIAVVAKDGKQLIIYPAQRPASRGGKVFPSIVSSGQSSVQASPRTAMAKMTAPSHPTTTDDSEVERSEMSSQGMTTPMLSASPNLMMSGLGLGSGNMFSGHAMGPPEAFFPFQSIAADGTMIVDGLDVGYDDASSEDDGENLLNIEDFVHFGDDSEDSDQDPESAVESRLSPANSSPSQNAAKPSSVAPSPTQSTFLDHLDKGMVTAFRRNQYEYESDAVGQSSKSPFRVANAMKANAFVASSPSSGSTGKRKLSDQHSDSPNYDHALTKRSMPNRF
ncbi:MAG: hypothetical protein Q9168_006311 [Polycauliona sp. 1 TL-2023]